MPATKNAPKPFLATITPASINKNNTASGVRYSILKDATVARKGRPTLKRTVMAFGRNNAAVARSLKVGKAIDLLCQFDGGTVRIVGKAPKAEKKAA